MKGTRLLHTSSLLFSFLSFHLCAAIPLSNEYTNLFERSTLTSFQQNNLKEATQFFQSNTAKLDIVKTISYSNGQVIDWIPIESQGTIASPPPSSLKAATVRDPDKNTVQAKTHLELDGAQKGPAGTVPILRKNLALLNPNQTLQQRLLKPAVPTLEAAAAAASNAGAHWYASAAQTVSNLGGSAIYSLFSPYTQSPNDFSLLQKAVIRKNVNGRTIGQTVEAGWIKFDAQVPGAHLFTYFTTNGYSLAGDNLSGWNREVTGWVQVDTKIYPGVPYTSLSTSGGTQYELRIEYMLHEGNWWLQVGDTWIGYYPASLFSANQNDQSNTLASGATQINFYGEIFNSGDAVTTSDMGSGEWPSTGFGHSAYIHNINYTGTNGKSNGFDGGSQTVISDASRYDMAASWVSGSGWGSYFYLGGPGAGGKIGG